MNSVILRPSVASKLVKNGERTSSHFIGCCGHKKYSIDPAIPGNNKIISQSAMPFFVIAKGLAPEKTEQLIDILRYLTLNRIGFEWQRTQVIRFRGTTHLYPIYEDNYVYMTESERISFGISDVSELLGYRLLWPRLTAIESLIDNENFSGLKIFDNMVLCSDMYFEYLTKREIERRQTELEFKIRKIEDRGIITYNSIELKKWLAAEIEMVWNIKRTTIEGNDFYLPVRQDVAEEEGEEGIEEGEEGIEEGEEGIEEGEEGIEEGEEGIEEGEEGIEEGEEGIEKMKKRTEKVRIEDEEDEIEEGEEIEEEEIEKMKKRMEKVRIEDEEDEEKLGDEEIEKMKKRMEKVRIEDEDDGEKVEEEGEREEVEEEIGEEETSIEEKEKEMEKRKPSSHPSPPSPPSPPSKKPKSSARMHSKNEYAIKNSYIVNRKVFPYSNFSSEEFASWIDKNINRILLGKTLIYTIPGFVSKESRRDKKELEKKYHNIYENLILINPWLKDHRPIVSSDLSVKLPVFSPEDLDFYLYNSKYKKISSSLGEGYFYRDGSGSAYQVSDDLLLWAKYLYAAKGFISVLV